MESQSDRLKQWTNRSVKAIQKAIPTLVFHQCNQQSVSLAS